MEYVHLMQFVQSWNCSYDYFPRLFFCERFLLVPVFFDLLIQIPIISEIHDNAKLFVD